MKQLITIMMAVTLGAGLVQGADPDFFYLCPASGNATTEAGKQLNRLKNRRDLPAQGDIDYAVSLTRLLKPGNDRSRWFQHQAVDLVAYVVSVKDAAPSSCNCDRPWRELTSTEIELAISDSARDTRPAARLIAVVTPRFRATMAEQGVDWSTAALRERFAGQFVRIQGWLVFDTDDMEAARNTTRAIRSATRATAWEIHPVTSIEPLPAMPTGLAESTLELSEIGVEIQPFNFSSR